MPNRPDFTVAVIRQRPSCKDCDLFSKVILNLSAYRSKVTVYFRWKQDCDDRYCAHIITKLLYYQNIIGKGIVVRHLVATAQAAGAASTCKGVDTSLTKERKQEYSQLVAKVVGKGVKPAQIEFFNFMQSGHWSAVYVSTPETDDGVLFFEEANGRTRFKDVWGGWAEPSEKPELTAWAKKLGAPENLARCFAKVVTEG